MAQILFRRHGSCSNGTDHVQTALVLCIVSMIRYDTYHRYIDPIHDTYRDTYRIILNTNIAETIIKLKSHMFHANIEAGIEHVCNISNRNFQKFPLAFRAGQFVDDTFY